MPTINPRILTWARESAGLSVEEAAKSIGLTGRNATERLAEMEAGKLDPTRRQIGEMARAYRRPLLTFYLAAPPSAGKRAHDFRTLADRESGSEGILDALVRDVRTRQALVRAALEDAEEADLLPFIGSIQMDQGATALANAIRSTWAVDIAQFRAARTADDAFRYLREKVEQSGVFVILMGNLGHHASNLSPKVFRGFALADPVAPFIVVNETDSRSAWSLTLLHELGHLLLGESGISGYDSDVALERICDEAAARVLLPQDELNELRTHAGISFDDLVSIIGAFASRRNLSRKMVAYNLLRFGVITAALYARLSSRFDKDRTQTAKDKPANGGGDYYVVRKHRVGAGLIRLVDRMVAGSVLTSTKAGRVLGVKPTAVGRMTANNRAA